MSEVTSEATVEIPEAFAENGAGNLPWVFELRRTLYCKAKQEPKYQFYTLYGLVCRQEVIESAWRQVSRNKGAPGMDGISIEDIRNSVGGEKEFLENIRQELLTKTYKPDVVKRVYVPKANGKLRPLGIPTVKDRVVQKAVLLVIEPIFEADFLECSHGFRPKRRAQGALEEIRRNLRAGRTEVYDADMSSYFDSIPHDKLMRCVEQRIKDGSIIKLIRSWLKAIMVEDNRDGKPPRYYRSKQGTPQGGVISPLLANIYLHYFDRMFHTKNGPASFANAKLVRYADDFVIMAKSIGNRVKEFVKDSLERRMGLAINHEKTSVIKASKKGNSLEFLGYVFRQEKAKRWNGMYSEMMPSPKSLKRIRAKISEHTSTKFAFKPIAKTIEELNEMLSGWANYFSAGYRANAYKLVDQHAQLRLIHQLKRRSQRGYKRPKETTWYRHLENLGYQRLSKRLRPCVS